MVPDEAEKSTGRKGLKVAYLYSELTKPKEMETTTMEKADIYRGLYNAAEFHLFGAGSWPADREASGAFWKFLNDFGLTTNVASEPGTIRFTSLGMELNAELMSIFAGAAELWDIPLLLDLMGHLDDEGADEIYTASPEHAECVIHRHVRRVYFKVFNRYKYLN
jgi:hypothetical protein